MPSLRFFYLKVFIIAILVATMASSSFILADEDGTILSVPPASFEAQISEILAGMDLKEKISQLFILDLFDDEYNPILAISDELQKSLTNFVPGGYVLYGQNIDTAEQVKKLVKDLQAGSRYPLIVAVDQEGGEVSRLTASGKIPATELPPARTVGKTNSLYLAYQTGKIMALELQALGISMNFAPVADVDIEGFSVMDSRSYGTNPSNVGDMVAAVVGGMQDYGVSAVLKHFPGHGGTDQDSHSETPSLKSGITELRKRELIPFQDGIRAGADGVMTAHIKIKGSASLATFSKPLLQDILRRELRFKKLIISDALRMKAVEENLNQEQSALQAIQAGVDLLLQPSDPEAARNVLINAVQTGVIDESRIDESVRRIFRVKLKRQLGRRAIGENQAVIGAPEHWQIVEEILKKAKN